MSWYDLSFCYRADLNVVAMLCHTFSLCSPENMQALQLCQAPLPALTDAQPCDHVCCREPGQTRVKVSIAVGVSSGEGVSTMAMPESVTAELHNLVS